MPSEFCSALYPPVFPSIDIVMVLTIVSLTDGSEKAELSEDGADKKRADARQPLLFRDPI
jgi:hypothetical protein